MSTPDDGSVTAAVARADPRKELAATVNKAAEWFGKIGASHVNTTAFIQLSLAQLDKVRDLRTAAQTNPSSFLSAMAECARLGLMPGDTGFYIPFKDKHETWTVAFIEHWTGVAELIYRTSLVEAIVCDVVRAEDEFTWIPSAMRVPEHHIPANDSGQVGLADQEDRGKLTAVYCYVRFKDGGTSFPTVMNAREVLRHRAISRAGENFWGPAYPAEGPWTPDMWRKTAIKKHQGSVPSSPEYQAQILASAAAAADAPEGVSAPAGEYLEPPAELAAIEGSPRTIDGAGSVGERRDHKAPTKAANIGRIGELFREAGLADPVWAQVRLALVGLIADMAEPPRNPNDLKAGDAAAAAQRIEGAFADCRQQHVTPGVALLQLAAKHGLWDGTAPPAPDWYVPAHPEQEAS